MRVSRFCGTPIYLLEVGGEKYIDMTLDTHYYYSTTTLSKELIS